MSLRRIHWSVWALLSACVAPQPLEPVGWDKCLPDLQFLAPSPSGLSWQRSIIHLHSPYSHDARDGNGYVDGVLNEACLADLRYALCETHIDVAFLTDHPAHAAEATLKDLLLTQAGDAVIAPYGQPIGNQITCPNGHIVQWYPGVEDELMPLALESDVAEESTP